MENLPNTKQETNGNSLALLIFNIETQAYSLPIAYVVRIIEMVTIIQIHNVSDFMQGLINFQGKAVPVMDMRKRLGFTHKPYNTHTPIILVDVSDVSQDESESMLLGLIVDNVEQVIYASPEQIKQATTKFLSKMHVTHDISHLAGVINIDRRMIIMLNVTTLLHPEDYELIANEELSNETEPIA
jgi:purine-binding chemotaxis protein CheW